MVLPVIVAAIAALSAFLTMLIHRRNLLESIRPEITLVDWTRRSEGQGESAHDVIAVQSIKNVGRGTAFNITFDALYTHNNFPVATMPTTRLPILANAETTDVAAEMIIWWKNVDTTLDESNCLSVIVTIYCWDSRQSRHRTKYHLFIVPLSPAVGVLHQIAPGVGLVERTTSRRSARCLGIMRRLARIPLVGRPFRKAADF